MAPCRKILGVVLFIAVGIVSVPAEGWASETATRGVRKRYSAMGLLAEEVITADKLHKLQERREFVLILDARSRESYQSSHIRGAYLPRSKAYYEQQELLKKGLVKGAPDADAAVVAFLEGYPKEVPIVTYCNEGCHASGVLLFQIKRLGFKNVKAMEEGFDVWLRKGYPVTQQTLEGPVTAGQNLPSANKRV